MATRILTSILILVLLVSGCSGSLLGGSPFVPKQTTSASVGVRDLWGLFQCVLDAETGSATVVPIRTAEFHLNVVSKLQVPMPQGLSIKINSYDPVEARADLDLTITHPFPNSNFRGFDVRGIVMGPGFVASSKSDPSAVYASPDGTRLENADGYTRWWNWSEFTTAGLFGFVTGNLGSQTLKPQATLNPYKYFADPLSATDPVTPKVDSTNRGTFSTAPSTKLTRNYIIRFPIIGGKPVLAFQYAVDASWAAPSGPSASPKPIDEYPPEANCPEAFNITVDSSKSQAYYVDAGDLGGDLRLEIEVFDWSAASNPDGIDGEIESITIESETLFDNVISVPVNASPGSQTVSGIYSVMVPVVHPTGLENQEVLVTVRSKSPTTYQPPAIGPDYPSNAHLAAYTLVEIPILDANPQYNYIQVDTPNGGEVWGSGGTEDILWTSVGTVGDNIKIQYSINDGAPVTVTDSTPNDGSFSWAGLPGLDSNQMRIIVKSVEKPLIWDESDDFFTIGLVGTLEVTSPNGGEVLAGDGKWDITWNSTGPVGNVIIELSFDSGQTWPQVIIDSTENDGIYTWDPVPWINKNACRMRITDLNDPTVLDESDADFSITQMGDSLTLIQPNGGEVLQVGGTYEIKWSWTGNPGDIRIELSTDSGSTYPTVIVPFTECDGSFIWDPIPDLVTSSARVRISTMEIPQKKDASDSDFQIAAK